MREKERRQENKGSIKVQGKKEENYEVQYEAYKKWLHCRNDAPK